MIVLGIETSTSQVGCAIGGVEGVLASFTSARPLTPGGAPTRTPPRHAEVLGPAIEFTCAQARVSLSQVTVVAVGVGPGLFTGLRVGLAMGKAIAQALRVPMIGLPSLDLLAFPLRHTERLLIPMIDARRGEVYTASYRHVPGGVQRVADYRICSPAELSAELAVERPECLLVGDGAVRYADEFSSIQPQAEVVTDHRYPSPAALVELAQPLALREEFVRPSELAPLYLRKPDAETAWENKTHGAWRGPGPGPEAEGKIA